MGTGKVNRGAPASSVECGTVREGPGARDKRKACSRGLDVGGAHEADDPRRKSVGTRIPAGAPDGLQQPTSRWPMPTGDRNVLPLPHTVETRRGRAASGVRPCPRPNFRSGHRPPTPNCGGSSVSAATGGAWATDDHPGVGTIKDNSGAPASSVERGTAREGSSVHDGLKAPRRGLATGGA